MILNPDFILHFGKNKGFALSEIYQYDPTYLEWLIEFIPDFEIDIQQFYKLPKPTIFYNAIRLKTSHGYIETSPHMSPQASVGDIMETGTFKEIDFKFSINTIKVLIEKKPERITIPIGSL